MIFWAVATALAASVAATLVIALLRPPRDAAARPELGIYRDQLAEVERDISRGTLGKTEAETARREVQRRLLDADRKGDVSTVSAPATLSGAVAALLGATVIGGTFAIYAWQGAPGYPDLPLERRIELAETMRAERPSQADAVAEFEERSSAEARADVDPEFLTLMEKLRTALETRPDDVEGFRLLARNEAGLGNVDAALAAQRRVIDIQGEEVSAADIAGLAELMVMQTGGSYISPEAEAALDAALTLDPDLHMALYYKGLAHMQVGRWDLAFPIWRDLLSHGPQNAPWTTQVRAQIEELAQLAGQRFDPPVERSGPDAATIAASQDMTADDRREMIEGMVASLADRLATEGGPAADWARLIDAYGVLGRQDAATAIWAEAQQVFAAAPDDMATLRAAADRAGVLQ